MEEVKILPEGAAVMPAMLQYVDGNPELKDLSADERFDLFERENKLGPYAPDEDDDC